MFRPEHRWWLVTLAIVGVLVLISALALSRPNVVWQGGKPHCPACRVVVASYSAKCPHCTTPFDWIVAPDEVSPISRWSLSALEADEVRKGIKRLGEEEAARRVAEVLSLSVPEATAYLDGLGRGRCGWCGGTGRELSHDETPGKETCASCLGSGACVACGGDRRMTRGALAARRAYDAYVRASEDLAKQELPIPVFKREARRIAQRFLERHAGTEEATEIFLPSREDDHHVVNVVSESRGRLDRVLEVLAEREDDGE